MTSAQLAEMAQVWEDNPDMTQADLAARYGISQPHANRLIKWGFHASRRRQGEQVNDPRLAGDVRREHIWHPEKSISELARQFGLSTTTVARYLTPDADTVGFVRSGHAAGLPLEQLAKENALTVPDVVKILRKQ